jgi:MFS family permease
MLNGNVGVMRTMIAEIIEEKKYTEVLDPPNDHFANLNSCRYQSRAFLILPMCFNIGVIVGPVLGGLLADPAGSYPDLFGDIWILKKFPYAPPNILSAVFLLIGAVCVFLGLEEVRSFFGFLRSIFVDTG